MTAYDLRQLRYLNAVRSGDVNEAANLLSADLGVPPWRVGWATNTDMEPRLQHQLNVGRLTSLAGGILDEHPVVAVSVQVPVRLGEMNEQVEVHDLRSGQAMTFPCAGVQCMSFAGPPSDPLLITGHVDGSLQIWDLARSALLSTIGVGKGGIRDLSVVDSNGRAIVAVRDSHGRITRAAVAPDRWVDELAIPNSGAMCGGRLSDGRDVVVVAGERLSLWDMATGRLEASSISGQFHDAISLVLSTDEGRDILTILTETRRILAFDLLTGEPLASPIDGHVNRLPEGRMRVWSPPGRRPKLAVLAGTVAVPTRWAVHLWNLRSSRQEMPPLSGPVAGALVESVRWRDRDYLITGSGGDGCVGWFDLSVPLERRVGHEGRIVGVSTTGESDVVVSVDRAGAVIARQRSDGALAAVPLSTGIEDAHSLVSWVAGGNVRVALGGGSRSAPDGRLWRWDLDLAELMTPTIEANQVTVNWLALLPVDNRDVLVTFGPRSELGMWRAADGEFVGERPTNIFTRVTGAAAGLVGGEPVVAVSTHRGPVTVYALDGLTSPTTIPDIGSDFVVDLVASRLVTGAATDVKIGWRTIRSWDLAGRRCGPDIHFDAEIIAVKSRYWPAAYVACADRSVSLVDLQSGVQMCAPMLLPIMPNSLAVTNNGELVVGFGNDVALVRPPAGLSNERFAP